MSDRAFSLIELLVVLGIGGIVALFFGKMLTGQMKAQRHVELRSDREAIKRTLHTQVSCQKSFQPGTCSTPGQLVELRGKNDQVIVSNDPEAPSMMGQWTLRAECNSDASGVFVRLARLGSTGTLLSSDESDFEVDPLTKRAITWASESSVLYPYGTNLCPDVPSSGVEVAEAMVVRQCPTGWELNTDNPCGSLSISRPISFVLLQGPESAFEFLPNKAAVLSENASPLEPQQVSYA